MKMKDAAFTLGFSSLVVGIVVSLIFAVVNTLGSGHEGASYIATANGKTYYVIDTVNHLDTTGVIELLCVHRNGEQFTVYIYGNVIVEEIVK